MSPSGIRPLEENGYTLRMVRPGLYSVEDAYRGHYEFFKGRPVPSHAFSSASGRDTRGEQQSAGPERSGAAG